MDEDENEIDITIRVNIGTNESYIETLDTVSATTNNVKVLENFTGLNPNNNDKTTKSDNAIDQLTTDVDLSNLIGSKEINIIKQKQDNEDYSMDLDANRIQSEYLAAETEDVFPDVSQPNEGADDLQNLSSKMKVPINSNLIENNSVNINTLSIGNKSNLKFNNKSNKTLLSIGTCSQNIHEDPENLPSCSKDSLFLKENSMDNPKNSLSSPGNTFEQTSSNQTNNGNVCIELCKDEVCLQSVQTNDTDCTHNSSSTNRQIADPESYDGRNSHISLDHYPKVRLYAEDIGPKLYPVKGKIVTPPIITKNLPGAFQYLPVHGMPKKIGDLEQFQYSKIREYVGCDLNDEEFNKLAEYCSPDHLKTGNELKLKSRFPTQEPLPEHTVRSLESNGVGDNLCIIKKLKLRMEKDSRHLYTKKLKYRGIKSLPIPQNDNFKISFSPLEPGKDLIFRVRVYRPFYCNGKERHNTRHSVFSNDIVLLGRQKLTALRDRLVCANDVGMRVDVSENPEDQPSASAKDVFPSGFLFINNAFYVDTRGRCEDHSVPIRQWAVKRKIGVFPRYDMTEISIDQLLIKLGHPEVYVHQGNCEHPFTFSEVRLLSATDPLRQSSYPFHTAISQNQTIYCTTCAEFGAKWIVTGCSRVPFDPAFFCESCFKLYLYKDGKKICDFKAYSYRGNELNILKPPV